MMPLVWRLTEAALLILGMIIFALATTAAHVLSAPPSDYDAFGACDYGAFGACKTGGKKKPVDDCDCPDYSCPGRELGRGCDCSAQHKGGPCSSACTCGCQDGGPCTCGQPAASGAPDHRPALRGAVLPGTRPTAYRPEPIRPAPASYAPPQYLSAPAQRLYFAPQAAPMAARSRGRSGSC